jgi:APA family basic amino acid/polyamine antiporter
VLATGAAVAAGVALGRVDTTWSFSAFTVLVYYAITNLAALRLPLAAGPRAIAALGLLGCASLAFWVSPAIWAIGLAWIGAGLLARAVARRRPAKA